MGACPGVHNGYGKYVLYAVREGQAADALCLLFESGFQAENLYGIEILPYFLYTIFNYVFHGAPGAWRTRHVARMAGCVDDTRGYSPGCYRRLSTVP